MKISVPVTIAETIIRRSRKHIRNCQIIWQGWGIDIEKPLETMPLEPFEGSIEYIAVQYIAMGNATILRTKILKVFTSALRIHTLQLI